MDVGVRNDLGSLLFDDMERTTPCQTQWVAEVSEEEGKRFGENSCCCWLVEGYYRKMSGVSLLYYTALLGL